MIQCIHRVTIQPGASCPECAGDLATEATLAALALAAALTCPTVFGSVVVDLVTDHTGDGAALYAPSAGPSDPQGWADWDSACRWLHRAGFALAADEPMRTVAGPGAVEYEVFAAWTVEGQPVG